MEGSTARMSLGLYARPLTRNATGAQAPSGGLSSRGTCCSVDAGELCQQPVLVERLEFG